jgi:hypothetical protein
MFNIRINNVFVYFDQNQTETRTCNLHQSQALTSEIWHSFGDLLGVKPSDRRYRGSVVEITSPRGSLPE